MLTRLSWTNWGGLHDGLRETSMMRGLITRFEHDTQQILALSRLLEQVAGERVVISKAGTPSPNWCRTVSSPSSSVV